MSFTAEEVWGFLPAVNDRLESVHLTLFPQPEELTSKLPSGFDTGAVESDWDTLLTVRNEALKALETARAEKQIGGSLEAQLHVAAPEQLFAVLERHRDQLRYLFIVSDVVLEKSPASNGDVGLMITVNRAPGAKCERCWNYSTHVGEDKTYPTVCERCSAVLSEIEATTRAR
jgi:isoleucyl-tRNA synthetase